MISISRFLFKKKNFSVYFFFISHCYCHSRPVHVSRTFIIATYIFPSIPELFYYLKNSILILPLGKPPSHHVQENKEYRIQTVFLSCKWSSLVFIMFYVNLQNLSDFISTTSPSFILVGRPGRGSHKPSAQAAVTTSGPLGLGSCLGNSAKFLSYNDYNILKKVFVLDLFEMHVF